MDTLTDAEDIDIAAAKEGANAGAALSAERLRELWRWALNVPGVDDGDSFFALGGQSMAAVVMLAELQDRHGIELSVDTVFGTPVFRDFWELVRRHADAPVPAAGHAAAAVTEESESGPVPLSFQQLQVWTAYQLSGRLASYNLPIVYRLQGPVDPAALGRALVRLACQHDILRTTYGLVDGVPQQTPHDALRIPFAVDDLRGPDSSATSEALRREMAALQATPLAIEHDPPIAVRLLRTGPQEWHLLVCVHHIAFDGWSLKVLFEDLGRHYAAALRGDDPARERPASVPYGRYARQSRRWAAEGSHAQALAYFNRYLEGLETLNALPTDFPRGAGGPGLAASVVRRLDGMRCARLAALAAAHATTPFVVFLSALALVVARQTHRPEAVIGVPTANRELADFRSTVGFFANTTPLRLSVRPAMSFDQWLKQGSENVHETLKHSRLPFPLLVQALGPARSSSCNPLFQIAFAFQNAPPPASVLPGIEASYLQAPNRFAKFDLTVNIGFDAEGGAQIDWEYDTALFRPGAMERLAERFEAALDWMERAGSQALSALPLLESEAPLVDRLAAAPTLGEGDDVMALFRQAADARPSSLAVVQGLRSLSYGELDHASQVLAHRLHAAGAQPGEPVAYAASRSLEAIVTQLAILKAGAAYLPMDTGYPVAQLAYMSHDSGARLFVGPSGLPPPQRMHAVAVDLEELAQAACPPPMPVRTPPGLAYLMYTSGTSGLPKGVQVPRSGIARLVRDNGYLALGPETVMLHAASPSFDAATFEVFGALLNGGRLVCYDEPRPDPQRLVQLIRDAGVTTMWLTAGLLPALADVAKPALPALRHLVTGGDVVSPEAVARLHRQQPQLLVVNGYGPTENTTFTTCHPIERGLDTAQALPIGRPISATCVRVVGLDGCPCGVDQPGELWAGGAGLALGYQNAPELTAERFVVEEDGRRWYRTGDLVRLRADGSLDFLGRLDQQLKIRGYRIDLATVEARLAAHPAVAQAAVLVVGAAAADKRLVGLYAIRDAHAADVQALKEWLSQALPNYAVPDTLHRVETLAVNANGKVDRAALREAYAQARHSAGPRARELDAAQHRVAALWGQLLQLPADLDPEADFFEMGGNSLLVTQLAARLSEAAGWPIAVSALYDHGTLQAQADLLRRPPAATSCGSGSGPAVLLEIGEVARPWFALPGVGGLAHAFADIGSALRRQGCGLRAFDSLGLRDGMAPLGLAASTRVLVDEIIRLQPEGPHALMGHSFGGRVAFEAALELERRGRQVHLLLLDAMPGNEVVDISRFKMPAEGPAGLAAWLLRAMGDVAGAAEEEPLRRLAQLGLFGPLAVGEVLANVEWQLRANRAYRPSGRLRQGTVQLLRAAQSDFGAAATERVESALALHCDRFTVLTLPGDHFSLLKRSAGEIAARALGQHRGPGD